VSNPAGYEIPCRGVLFDCDGVLVDSTVSGTRAWSRWAIDHGLDPAQVLDGVHGRRSAETVARFLPQGERAAGVAAIDAAEIADAPGTPALPGAAELLASLPGNWAVVTSATTALFRARLAAAGLPLPAVTVTADDVESGKPSPEGYLLAARRLGIRAAQCVVVEDSNNGILAGRAAGVSHVLGIGTAVTDSSADSVVTDLRACRWSAGGLMVDPSYVLRAPS
jgi:sugar-phosphatase